jgi:hypothetical protein
MSDLALSWGTDLQLGPTGDLAAVQGTTLGGQRVLRRLLTNPRDYIWQPNYGGGLASFVGSPTSTSQVRAVISAQLLQEGVVASVPSPIVEVETEQRGRFNMVIAVVKYTDAVTNDLQTLNFTVGA